MTPPRITMIVCTRNRAPQLRRALESAARLRIPTGLVWELLVIDNGSSDGTLEVATEFQDRLPLRVIREDRAGLSNARNRGVAEAAGQYIVWTDDDVLLDPEWLAAYADAFENHPEAAVFGGRIIPLLEQPSPRWFVDISERWPIAILLARRDFGPEPLPLDFAVGRIPFGANFAIRASEQRLVPYEPGLGVSPDHRRVGEEAETIFRLLERGAVGWWTPAAKVTHLIPSTRQSWAYIFDYSASYGETIAYLQKMWPASHHLSSAKDVARISCSSLELRAKALIYRVASYAARAFGGNDRGARYLATSGMFAGAARLASVAKV